MTGEPSASTASQIASTWSDSVIPERSVSLDSRPGSVMAVTSWPSRRRSSATSSQAQAPSQNPGTRMIGAAFEAVIRTCYRGAGDPGFRGPGSAALRIEAIADASDGDEPWPGGAVELCSEACEVGLEPERIGVRLG